VATGRELILLSPLVSNRKVKFTEMVNQFLQYNTI